MRRNTGPSPETRIRVLMRDDNRCAKCGCALPFGFQMHHRRPRGMGGSKDPQANSPANLIPLDEDCHRWIESRREEALENGWLVPQGKNPAEWAIAHALHGVVYLLDDFTFVPVEQVPDGAA